MHHKEDWQGAESPNRPKVVVQFVQNPVRMFEPSPGCAVRPSQIRLYGTSIEGGHPVAVREEE